MFLMLNDTFILAEVYLPIASLAVLLEEVSFLLQESLSLNHLATQLSHPIVKPRKNNEDKIYSVY